MPRNEHSRRDFLKKSMLAAAAGSATPYFSWSQRALANASANDRPIIGCIGVGDMATGSDCPEHAQFGDIVAVCDVDASYARRAKNHPKIGKGKADAYGDYRKVLDRNDIDVVSIVTVDHWHVKIAIEALQAGKHVFCQKPLTLTLEENQLIRNACKKYANRVFIVGTQQRSDIGRFLRAVNMVQKGLLGDIRKITVGIGRLRRAGRSQRSPHRRSSTGTSGSARHRRSIISRNAATTTSAGGMNTLAASLPTGARITSTSPPGPSGRTSKVRAQLRSTGPTPSIRCR